MSGFWLLYWIELGINIIVTAFVAAFFDIEDYSAKTDISWSYVMLSDLIAAIPGVGMFLTAFIIFGVVGGAFSGTLVPKENPFGKSDDE